MICLQCSQEITDRNARFCANCGTAIEAESEIKSIHKGNVFTQLADRINQAAGMERPKELKLNEVFSMVFKQHSEEEAERLFMVGTSLTTPSLDEITDTWPKPWLFARVFLIVAVSYIGLYFGFSYYDNFNFLPGLITMGSFLVPMTLLIFFWEMNAPQNIAIYKVIKMVFVGGILSLVMAAFLYETMGYVDGTLMIGIVEEASKVLIALWFLKERKYRFILNGLLIGAAIGAGFAAFETAGYVLRVALSSDLESMYNTIFWRGVLAPGGHIVWAALTGAAICMVKGDKDFTWAMLKDIRFLRIFVIVVILHAAWDLPWPLVSGLPLVQLLLTVVSWILAFTVMNVGLKEISLLKKGTPTQ